MQLTTLPNGLKIVTHSLPGTESLTCLVLVGAGSRHETPREMGLAHFLEHMFFKGGEKYQKPKEVAEAIDSIGGDFNAFTGKEYAGYYVKAAASHADTVYSVLSDMLLRATFPAEEIERERGVILEEYNMYQDAPMYQIGWNFERLLFGDQPMGWDQIGTPDTIRSFSREDFVAFKEKFYQPGNTVIAVAGKVEHEQAVAEISRHFAFQTAESVPSWLAVQPLAAEQPVTIQNKKTEQGHLVIGVPGVPSDDPRHFVQRVLAVILGGNMSSRMFLTVREEKGLCYSVRTSTDDYTDSGVVSTYAGVTLEKVEDAIGAIVEEYKKIAAQPVSAEELARGKEYLKGKMTLRLEDSEEYAHLLAQQFLLKKEQLQPAEIFARIDAVTAEEIQQLAAEIFVAGNLRLAAIGPFEGREAAFAARLK